VFEEKRILFAYAAFKTHLDFMPTRSALGPFKEELAGYITGKDTIQFPTANRSRRFLFARSLFFVPGK